MKKYVVYYKDIEVKSATKLPSMSGEAVARFASSQELARGKSPIAFSHSKRFDDLVKAQDFLEELTDIMTSCYMGKYGYHLYSFGYAELVEEAYIADMDGYNLECAEVLAITSSPYEA